MQISLIASLHVNVQSERVGLRVNLISLRRVVQLLQHLARADTPALILDANVGRRVIVSLEEVRRVEMG
jgi:hypothetical protein